MGIMRRRKAAPRRKHIAQILWNQAAIRDIIEAMIAHIHPARVAPTVVIFNRLAAADDSIRESSPVQHVPLS